MRNGRQLLAESKAGVNPLEGWTPELPVGETLTFGTRAYDEAEGDGLAHLSDDGCAFVLVRGHGWGGGGREGRGVRGGGRGLAYLSDGPMCLYAGDSSSVLLLLAGWGGGAASVICQ